MSFIPNKISRITSHAHSCIPDTNTQIRKIVKNTGVICKHYLEGGAKH